MTTTTKTKSAPKASKPAAPKTSDCMCRGDLVALVAATLMSKGNLPMAAALESAKYIAEAAHEPS